MHRTSGDTIDKIVNSIASAIQIIPAMKLKYICARPKPINSTAWSMVYLPSRLVTVTELFLSSGRYSFSRLLWWMVAMAEGNVYGERIVLMKKKCFCSLRYFGLILRKFNDIEMELLWA